MSFFSVDTDDEESYDLTKENEPLKIMRTVVRATEDFIQRMSEEEFPLTISFDGTLKTGETKDTASARTRLYKQYVKKILGDDVTMRIGDTPNDVEFVVEEKP